MSDSDSDLGIIPVLMNRVKRKTPIQRIRRDAGSDEESLYESTQKKVKKMNKKKRVVLKDGLTNVTYKGRPQIYLIGRSDVPYKCEKTVIFLYNYDKK